MKPVSGLVSRIISLNLNIKLYDTCNKWVFTLKKSIDLARAFEDLQIQAMQYPVISNFDEWNFSR